MAMPAALSSGREAAKLADLVEVIAPRREDRFVVKPRYSAFDHTP